MNCKPDNPIVNKIFYILLQVLFISIFLTIFFFTYVHSTEKAAFKTQVNIVVDDLFLDLNVRQLVPEGQEGITNTLISSMLDLSKKNSMKSLAEDDDRIKKQNNKIMKKAFLCIGIFSVVLLVVAISLYLSGYCLPFRVHIKDALIVVFFVMITELMFLIIITKEYWSVDPSAIRQTLGDTVQDYIKNNHPQNN